MKRILILATFVVLTFAIAASAQKATDFSGTWTLDTAKSKLAGRDASIESQTLTVTQTATDLKVETATKRSAPPAGGGGGGGRMGGGGGMGGDGATTYALDGKEVKSEMQTQMGSMTMTTKAKVDGSKIDITRSMTTQMGERTSTEKWSLGTDGTLSIDSTRPTRDGGSETSTRVFTKK